jgi:surfactin synthase thioesterase subunit
MDKGPVSDHTRPIPTNCEERRQEKPEDLTMQDAWLRPDAAEAKTRLRLFCFPHAGGGASKYYRWSDQVPAAIRLMPVQLPGREQRLREQPFAEIEPLVEAAGAALQPHFDRPFALLGQSMGALVAFELARWLRRGGHRQPRCLVVASSAAPQVTSCDDPIHLLPRSQFLAELQSRYGGVPAAVAEHKELMDLLLPALRADVAVVETYCYQHEPPLEYPVLAIGGTDDHVVSPAKLAAWSEQTAAEFQLKMLPGDHFVLDSQRQTALPAIARFLEIALA